MNKVETAKQVAVKVATIAYSLLSHIWFALQMFWDEHGDEILTGIVRAFFYTADFTHEVFSQGQKARRAFDRYSSEWADRAFFYSAGFFS